MKYTGDHPWGKFLSARYEAIIWIKEHMNRTDAQIAHDLSMDEKQVYLIRTYPINKKE